MNYGGNVGSFMGEAAIVSEDLGLNDQFVMDLMKKKMITFVSNTVARISFERTKPATSPTTRLPASRCASKSIKKTCQRTDRQTDTIAL